MTIRQATSWLSQPGIVTMIHDPTTRQALRVAVKALERLMFTQPISDARDTQYNLPIGTDCISRQAAISAICNACGKIDCDKMDKCEKLQLPPANCSEFPNNSDTISRQAAIDAAQEWFDGLIVGSFNGLKKKLEAVPPAQPEIIRCRNCKFASGDSRICMKFGHSPIGELDFCSFAERREVTT